MSPLVKSVSPGVFLIVLRAVFFPIKPYNLCLFQVGVYMAKRDFVDRCDSVDPVGEFDPWTNRCSGHLSSILFFFLFFFFYLSVHYPPLSFIRWSCSDRSCAGQRKERFVSQHLNWWGCSLTNAQCAPDGRLVMTVLLSRHLVYIMLSCTFKYGREDQDVLGMIFRRDIFLTTRQVYPDLQDKERSTHTKIQEKLLHKLGDNAFPFFFEVRASRKYPTTG